MEVLAGPTAMQFQPSIRRESRRNGEVAAEIKRMRAKRQLAAVAVERSRELLEHRARRDSRSSQRSTTLLRATHGQVARARRTMLRLAASGQTESFLRTFVRFLLRHDPLNPSGALRRGNLKRRILKCPVRAAKGYFRRNEVRHRRESIGCPRDGLVCGAYLRGRPPSSANPP